MRVSLRLSAVALASALLAACSTTTVDETAKWSPNKLYREATDERNAGNFEKAVSHLE